MYNRISDFSFFEQNSFGDTALYKELLAIFAKTTPVMVAQLKKAFAEGDYEQLSKGAHKLKSNVQSIGLENVYALLDKIENGNLAQMDQAYLKQILDVVFENCGIAVAEVEDELHATK